MKGRRILVGLLTVLSLAVLTAAPALATEVGPYEVTFVKVLYNYPDPGYSTWYYTVDSSESAEHAISHVVFELGVCCRVVDAGVWTDYTARTSWWLLGEKYIELDYLTAEVIGLKFNWGFNDGETRNYYFTVEGNHAVDVEGITVAVKTGRGGGPSALLMRGAGLLASVSGLLFGRADLLAAGEYETSIPGPDLDCTTAVTLNNFSATSPSGSSVPVLLIPVALLGTAVLVAGAMVLTGRLRRQEL